MDGFKLIALLSIPLLSGCSSGRDEPETPGGGTTGVIEFSAPFVEVPSRSVTGNGLDSPFRLWGVVGNTSNPIFDGNLVSERQDGVWRCERTEYWYPGQTYYFLGLAPADTEGLSYTLPASPIDRPDEGFGSVEYDLKYSLGSEDVVCAVSDMRTPDPLPQYVPPVEMSFEHLLSQVRLTFHNNLNNPHYFINIYGIMLCDLPGKGRVDLGTPDRVWTRVGWESVWLPVGSGSVFWLYPGSPQESDVSFVLPLAAPGAKVQIQPQVFYTKEPYGKDGRPVDREKKIGRAHV